MKKLFLLFSFLSVLVSCENESITEELLQPSCENIFVGNVTLATQAEVDEFGILGYCSIEGNLTIGAEFNVFVDSDITSISELNSLRTVSDTLNIRYNPGLSNVIGMENLETLRVLNLHRNINLINIDAFENINGQVSSITISENLDLTDLSGLDNITSISGQLNILGNLNVISLEGLDNLRTIGSLLLSSNTSLTSATDLQGSIITESLVIQGCNFSSLEGISVNNQLALLALNISGTITSIDALSNLTGIDYLLINEMDGLNSLEALNNLESVTELSVWQNDNLISLNGLNNLQSAENISITNNQELINYCALENLFSNGTYGDIIIENNTYNPTIQNIVDGNCEETPCDNGTYEGDLELATQQHVDDFGAMCYTSINGSLTIGINDSNVNSESNITSLNILNSLVEISGGLTITQIPNLSDLNGLHNLTSISGNLEIRRCDMLTDFNELSNLTNTSEEMYVAIGKNASLTSLNGLSGINDIYALAIFLNPSLTVLEGLGTINSGGFIQLDFNDSLISLQGLNFTGNSIQSLHIQNQDAITSMAGLGGLVNVMGVFDIRFNDDLADYCDLQNLFTNGTYDSVLIVNNEYNPTVQDIIDGNCAQ